jgi:hypothetical protein
LIDADFFRGKMLLFLGDLLYELFSGLLFNEELALILG